MNKLIKMSTEDCISIDNLTFSSQTCKLRHLLQIMFSIYNVYDKFTSTANNEHTETPSLLES